MGSRFVRPDTARLEISRKDWLVVKRRLNAGEARRSYARLYRTIEDGQRIVEPLETGMSLILAYLLDWSLTDDAGKPVVIRDQPEQVVRAALDAIDLESFTEIKEAIEQHEAAMAAERDASKKIPDGVNGSSAISPSPDGADGVMSGLLNSTLTSTTS